ncbi:hypothetical protein FACS1894188_02690 [Clostridia bacterium]|nr:hypothetical protein FACS1894188_02690 [Clostridia bacterium]
MDNLAEAYFDERPYEILDGEIFYMSCPMTSHNRVKGNIYNIFKNFLKGKKCEVFPDPTSVFFNKKDVVIPDVMVVCDPNIVKEDGIHGAPDLIVEVLSPSTGKNDETYKKKLYEKQGVKEYWVVSSREFSIKVYALKDGVYEIDNMYYMYPNYTLKRMTDEEKAKIETEFTTSLYGDELKIQIADVFCDLDMD